MHAECVDALSGVEDVPLCPLSVSGRLHGKLLEALGASAMDEDHFSVHQCDVLPQPQVHRTVVWRSGQGIEFTLPDTPGSIAARITCIVLVGKQNEGVQHVVFVVDVLGMPSALGMDMCLSVGTRAIVYDHIVRLSDATMVRLIPSPEEGSLWVLPPHKPF